MKRALIAAILLIPIANAAAAQPATAGIEDVRAYTQAMRETLSNVGVRIEKIDSPRDELLVVYTLDDTQPPPEFALGAVLRLSEPLSSGATHIRIRSVQGRNTLLDLRVPPGQIDSVLQSTVSASQREEIDELLRVTLAAAGVEQVQVPRPPATPPPAAPTDAPGHDIAPVDEADPAPRPTPRDIPQDPVDEAPVEPEPSEAAIVPIDARATAGALVERLVQQDIENISITVDAAGLWIISFENRTWRTDMDALARVLEAASETLPPMPIRVQVKRHDVVVSHVSVELADWARLQAGVLATETLSQNWRVMAGPAPVTDPVEVLARGGESHQRVDLLMRPAVEYTIGLEHDPFVSDYFLLTDARTTLAPGLWANLRFPLQLTSTRRLTMDRGLVSWVGRPFEDVIATGSFGKFGDDLHGYYGEMRTDTETHQFGLIGALVDTSFSIRPTDSYVNALGYYQYDWTEIGLKTRLGYGQFLESGDRGLTLSLRRRYGESFIETRATRTDAGKEGVSLEFSVPLGPRRASPPEDLRLRSDTALRLEYLSDFNVQGDYLRGPHDLESFRGELSPAYLGAHADRVTGRTHAASEETWPVAPSYEGTSGLIRIPTADVIPDGRLIAGVSYLDRRHSKVVEEETDAMPAYVGFSVLPDLELVGRLTFLYDSEAYEWDYNLDRSMSVHYRLNRQRGDWFPAFAAGYQDLMFGTETSHIGEGGYVVGTLQRDRMRGHLGVGGGKFSPLFAGFEMSVGDDPRVHALADYDSRYVNAGVRWFVEDWGTVSISLLGLRSLTGSMTFQTDLP